MYVLLVLKEAPKGMRAMCRQPQGAIIPWLLDPNTQEKTKTAQKALVKGLVGRDHLPGPLLNREVDSRRWFLTRVVADYRVLLELGSVE